ncbi:MAG: TetR/AcrR family transcriptional regulator [Microthrixaceae bacterium]
MSTKRAYRMVLRQEQANLTRSRLLDAAWARFSREPYESVRLADVAADAGVSVQTLHTSFGTKEDLFTAAMQRWMEAQGSARVVARSDDIAAIVRVLHANYEDEGETGLRIMAQEDRIPAVKMYIDVGREWQRQWVANAFDAHLTAAPPKARADLHDQLVVACDILTWKLLRLDVGHSVVATRRIVAGMIEALVAPHGVSGERRADQQEART